MAALTKVKIVGMTLAKRQRRVQIVELVVKEDGRRFQVPSAKRAA